MRRAFIETLISVAEHDERIWLLCGDVGFSILERFAERFPERFVNVGVAEQNMIGVAAGLALTGKVAFVYSIANFPVMRCLEQIRNDVCYHNLNVKIVAVGAGLAYGAQGYTHHAVEDLGVMRLLPNMSVFSPADPIETVLVTKAAATHQGPCYLRLGKTNEPRLHSTEPAFEVGKAIRIRKGQDAAIIATGSVLKLALDAADDLAAQGVSTEVASMPTLQPFDSEYVKEVAARVRCLVTVEEHALGGLGTATGELLARLSTGTRFEAIRLAPGAINTSATRESVRHQQGISVDLLVRAVSNRSAA